jgi:hypothetical protein
MVFALAALKHEWFDWFERCPEDINFSFEEVESALMKVAAYKGSISPPDEPWWDSTRPPDAP